MFNAAAGGWTSAWSSGLHVPEVNRLLTEFEPMQAMMKKMKRMDGMKGVLKF